MPSFPASVKTFTTKNTGDTIQPADVNDLQDEVNAIEAGLLNGTARLNSSNSTLATLSVTGGSTFTGAVTFSTGVTFAGTVQASTLISTGGLSVNGNAMFSSVIGCKVRHGTRVELLTGSDRVRLVFDTELFDGDAMHSTTTNSSRLTVNTAGKYLIGGQVVFSSVASAQPMELHICKNSTAQADRIGSLRYNGVSSMAMNVVGIDHVASTGDFYMLQVNVGSSCVMSTKWGGSIFWATRLGA